MYATTQRFLRQTDRPTCISTTYITASSSPDLLLRTEKCAKLYGALLQLYVHAGSIDADQFAYQPAQQLVMNWCLNGDQYTNADSQTRKETWSLQIVSAGITADVKYPHTWLQDAVDK